MAISTVSVNTVSEMASVPDRLCNMPTSFDGVGCMRWRRGQGGAGDGSAKRLQGNSA